MTKPVVPNSENLAKMICIWNGISCVDVDGSPNWWMFSAVAEQMLVSVDKEKYDIGPAQPKREPQSSK